ncbi:MAG: Bax inhibitor-1/YccA family protein [Marinilabiliaceae bacterium]|nr:Bax inhibitor-1/YccA family protein [Marinilabiliaceae bacterium]
MENNNLKLGKTTFYDGGVNVVGTVLMRKVFSWMALALLITGLTAWIVAGSEQLLSIIFSSKATFFGLIIGELVLVVAMTSAINRMSLTTATLLMVLYSVINGATMSSIFLLYTADSIASTFFVTAGTFGVMSLYGYATKRDLSSWGNILFMGVIGLIIAGVVNMFWGNGTFSLIVSALGVIIFVALTAYDVQKIKVIFNEATAVDETTQKIALLGALSLYLDFINIFLYLLRFLGSRK